MIYAGDCTNFINSQNGAKAHISTVYTGTEPEEARIYYSKPESIILRAHSSVSTALTFEGRVICRGLQDDHVIVYEPVCQNSFELKMGLIQSSLCPHLSPLQATINESEANDTFESFTHLHMCIAHSWTPVLSVIRC